MTELTDVFEIQSLGEAQVLCEFCQGMYSVQLEVVCGVCERSLCPLCATRARRTYRCPDCRTTERFDPG